LKASYFNCQNKTTVEFSYTSTEVNNQNTTIDFLPGHLKIIADDSKVITFFIMGHFGTVSAMTVEHQMIE
jgi:hypothetical protein